MIATPVSIAIEILFAGDASDTILVILISRVTGSKTIGNLVDGDVSSINLGIRLTPIPVV